MGRPKVDLARKIGDILGHSESLSEEAATPLPHYRRSVADIWNLLDYVELGIESRPHYPAAKRRHLSRLNGMILVNLIETFERYLKEVAAACVDFISPYVLDDRFHTFSIKASALAVHFEADSLGRSLCESVTWLDCKTINARFGKLLADPFSDKSTFLLFPQSKAEKEGAKKSRAQKVQADRRADVDDARTDAEEASENGWRFDTLRLVWQLRHTVVHNVGVITRSDAVKFRLIVKRSVDSPRFLAPTRYDLRYIKQFLDESAIWCNGRIGRRLAEVLTRLHDDDPSLFFPADMAEKISKVFGIPLAVADAQGTLPPL